jgi:heme-degrading monooxygenase HmoA
MVYARAGFYTAKPGTLDDVLKKAEAELIPMNRQQPGFRSYFLIRTGPDSVVSVTSWESKAQADAAAERLSGWVRREMGPSLEKVENHVGEVVVSDVPPNFMTGYGRVAVWRFKPGTADALSAKVRDEMVPLMVRQPGFTGYGVARTGEESAVSVTGFASKEQAQAAARETGAWVQEHAMSSVASVERSEGEILWSVRAEGI